MPLTFFISAQKVKQRSPTKQSSRYRFAISLPKDDDYTAIHAREDGSKGGPSSFRSIRSGPGAAFTTVAFVPGAAFPEAVMTRGRSSHKRMTRGKSSGVPKSQPRLPAKASSHRPKKRKDPLAVGELREPKKQEAPKVKVSSKVRLERKDRKGKAEQTPKLRQGSREPSPEREARGSVSSQASATTDPRQLYAQRQPVPKKVKRALCKMSDRLRKELAFPQTRSQSLRITAVQPGAIPAKSSMRRIGRDLPADCHVKVPKGEQKPRIIRVSGRSPKSRKAKRNSSGSRNSSGDYGLKPYASQFIKSTTVETFGDNGQLKTRSSHVLMHESSTSALSLNHMILGDAKATATVHDTGDSVTATPSPTELKLRNERRGKQNQKERQRVPSKSPSNSSDRTKDASPATDIRETYALMEEWPEVSVPLIDEIMVEIPVDGKAPVRAALAAQRAQKVDVKDIKVRNKKQPNAKEAVVLGNSPSTYAEATSTPPIEVIRERSRQDREAYVAEHRETFAIMEDPPLTTSKESLYSQVGSETRPAISEIPSDAEKLGRKGFHPSYAVRETLATEFADEARRELDTLRQATEIPVDRFASFAKTAMAERESSIGSGTEGTLMDRTMVPRDSEDERTDSGLHSPPLRAVPDIGRSSGRIMWRHGPTFRGWTFLTFAVGLLIAIPLLVCGIKAVAETVAFHYESSCTLVQAASALGSRYWTKGWSSDGQNPAKGYSDYICRTCNAIPGCRSLLGKLLSAECVFPKKK